MTPQLLVRPSAIFFRIIECVLVEETEVKAAVALAPALEQLRILIARDCLAVVCIVLDLLHRQSEIRCPLEQHKLAS
jgi:hypothetical protein